MEKTVKMGLRHNPRLRNKLIFYVVMLLWPLLQQFLFYVYVNLNTFILAFQKMEPLGNGQVGYATSFAGIDNFVVAFNELIISAEHSNKIWNSSKFFLIDFPVALTLALVFSFYIYKKYPMAGFFKVVLYMPALISGLVFSILFRTIALDGYKEICSIINYGSNAQANLYTGLLYQKSTAAWTLIFFNIFFSFGANMLMYSGAMSGIDESLVESCHLDGCNLIQEFWYISVPLIFPTIISLTITSLTGLVTNQMNILSLFGESVNVEAEVSRTFVTQGYTMYVYTKQIGGDLKRTMAYGGVKYMPSELSAYGLIITAVFAPLIIWLRAFLRKHGPSVD